MLIEPRTFDVKQLSAREMGERERINSELGDRLIRPGIGLVIKNVQGAVPDLEKIEVPGDGAARACLRCKLDRVLSLDRIDVCLREPYWYFHSERDAVIGEHEPLKGLVAQFVIAARWDDKGGCVGGRVLLTVHDGMGNVGE